MNLPESCNDCHHKTYACEERPCEFLDEELLREAQDAATEITGGALLEDLVAGFRIKRHPGDFYNHPSNEQMSYFVRGGR